MYWPKEGSETYGHIQVKLLQEVVMATYTLRTFTARNLKLKKRGAGERTVYQYHYTNWPDHGVPDHPLPVLSFVRKSASANPSGAGAIICHCSAGCGRSGTYIVIDAMLKQIRHKQSINVVDFLKHIRSQRNYLVQTEEQYIFIHDAIVEAIDSGETEIASNFIAKYLQLLQTGGASQLNQTKSSAYSISNGLAHSPNSVQQQQQQQQQQALCVASDNQLASSQSNLLSANPQLSTMNQSTNTVATSKSGASMVSAAGSNGRSQSAAAGAGQWSLLERQYRLVASFKAKDFNVVSALKPCNKNKNRTLNLIPLEAHRVHITLKPGSDGSDYINATFLMGFNHLREFIVTQHPVFETFSDFWQMVYDHNSQTIVLLSQMAELKEFGQFWPQKEDEVDYGSFKVKLIQESTLLQSDGGASIVARDFIMRSNQDDYELQTRLIHCPGWPESCGPLSSVFDLIKVVQSATQQQASQQKLHDGQTRSTTVTIGQEHEPQNGGPIIVVDKFGGTEAATFAVLTTLFKQINFEDAVDVYMYAKLAHLRRPGIWSSQDDYLFLYRAIENYASSLSASAAAPAADKLGAELAAQNGAAMHNQTMTLDRHRHKSSMLKTSTMRRPHNNNNNNNNHNGATLGRPVQVLNFSGSGPHANSVQPNSTLLTSGASQLSKSNNPLLIDHNHNPILYGQVGGPQQFQQVNNMMFQRNNQQQLHTIKGSMNPNANSPYNSAISIGANSHQHLLANESGALGSKYINTNANSINQNSITVAQQQATDHYLYQLN